MDHSYFFSGGGGQESMSQRRLGTLRRTRMSSPQMTSFQGLCTPPIMAHLRQLEMKHFDGPLYMKTTQIMFSDVAFESELGRGRYTNVFQVRIRSNASEKRYALKSLNPSRIRQYADAKQSNGGANDPKQSASQVLAGAAEELYREATILSGCDHPSIIRLQGVAIEGLVGSFSINPSDPISLARGEHGYFILLDRISETLEQRLPKWRQLQQGMFPRIRRSSLSKSRRSSENKHALTRNRSTPLMAFDLGSSNRSDETQGADLSERMAIATSIASAVTYLHNNRQIVVRDLCPESIGFDAWTGEVKLFNLGLARTPQECFLDIQLEGNFRYMAPEIMLCQPSGFPGDIYSFGVLLWEIITLERPYDAFFTPGPDGKEIFAQSKFRDQVILNKQWRPNCASISDPEAKRLIQECWCSDPDARPNAEQVFWRLEQSIVMRQRIQVQQRRLSVKGGFRRTSFHSTSTGSGGKANAYTDSYSSTSPKQPRRRSSLLQLFSRRGSSSRASSSGDPIANQQQRERPSEMELAAAEVAAGFLEDDDNCSEDSIRAEPRIPGEGLDITTMAPPPPDSTSLKNQEAAATPSLSLSEFRARLKVSTPNPTGKQPTSTISLEKIRNNDKKPQPQSLYSLPGAYSSKDPPFYDDILAKDKQMPANSAKDAKQFVDNTKDKKQPMNRGGGLWGRLSTGRGRGEKSGRSSGMEKPSSFFSRKKTSSPDRAVQ